MINPIKKYIYIGAAAIVLAISAAAWHYKSQYEKSIADLAVAEQTIENKNATIEKIEQDVIGLSKELEAANDVLKNIKEQKQKSDRDVAALRKKLKEFEFDRAVEEDKPAAEIFLNDEYLNLLNCIEKSSGKGESQCVN